MDYAEKMQKCHEYVEALEEERRKIQVFKRELPLCLELVTQAIEACKRELSTVTTTTTEYMHGQSDSSGETSSDRPVLEEFIPIKRVKSSSDNGEEDDDDNKNNDNGRDEQQSHKRNNSKSKEKSSSSSATAASDHKRKSDWLRSVQLWSNNESPDSPSKEELPRKAVVTEVKRNGGGAFQPFHREKISAGKSNSNHHQAVADKAPSSVPTSATSSSTAETGGTSGGGGGSGSKKEEKEGQTQKKQRRCWSPELHRRFLHALQQLGGSHVATPKQIRDLMKVDGLTNDEVKSHLQKYRLHTRRPTPAVNNNSNPPQPAPQFVVVGGIWVPPPEYAAVATTAASGETTTIAPATNTIYAPVAAAPPSAAVPRVSTPTTATTTTTVVHKPRPSHSVHLQSEGRGSHSEGGVQSNSPSTSSSTHTTTASPLL